MFSPLRNRFGIPGAISVIALVFAMLGGAYPANDSGSGDSKASASAKKAKKGPRGPRGPKGPPGPAGPQGPAGANGKDGATGANGSNGASGAPGAAGKSVLLDSFSTEDEENEDPAGVPCELLGGLEVKVEGSSSPKFVCNGEVGAPGQDGQTGFTETLPSGKTETGVWAASFPAESGNFVSMSFAIPLASAISTTNLHFIGAPNANCPGSASNPQAAAGHLCAYKAGGVGFAEFTGFEFSGKSGVVATFLGEAFANAYGSWAVTAP